VSKRVRVARAFLPGVLVAVLAAAACVPLDPQTRRPDLPAGQHVQAFQREQAKGGAVNYLLYLPQGYDAAGKRWPMIFYLHGRSLRGDDPERLKAYGLPRLVDKDPTFPFIVVSPQCRDEERWTDTSSLVALLDDVVSRYPVDRERVYLTGYSMGGGGAWRLGGAHPERFAAVAALAATSDTSVVKGLAQVPVWAIHGSADESTPVDDSIKMVDAIKAAGGDATLTILPDRDHNIVNFYDGKELYDWFLKHRRGAVPNRGGDGTQGG
jgi:predicted peptidase